MFVTIYHSSFSVPTRRVAVGENNVNSFRSDQIKKFLGPLLGRLLSNVGDQSDEVVGLVEDLESGFTPSSRLRCRIQNDRQGLKIVEVRFSEFLETQFVPASTTISSQQILLGVIMAVNGIDEEKRRQVLRWIKVVAGRRQGGVESEILWAKEVLGFGSTEDITESQIKIRFRETLREVHPDRGKNEKGWLVDELMQARKTLLETKKD